MGGRVLAVIPPAGPGSGCSLGGGGEGGGVDGDITAALCKFRAKHSSAWRPAHKNIAFRNSAHTLIIYSRYFDSHLHGSFTALVSDVERLMDL